MKIIQVIPQFRLAGAERMAEALLLELKRMGCDVIAVSLYNERSAITENLESNGIKVYYMGKRKGPDISIPFKLLKLFRRERPDVVHTHLYISPYAHAASIAAGIKARIHTVHNIAEKERMPNKLQNFLYHHCNVIPVGLSPLVKRSVEAYYKLSEEKVPMVYNGINMKKVVLKQDYTQNENFRFLHVGRFAEQKNHETMVKAFAAFHKKHPDSTLTLVGIGELYENICDLIAEMGMQDCIHTLGQINNMMEQYPKYDAFILPSQYEGMPITLIEAMATGMPIAASAVGGVPDMLTHGHNGLLCTADADSIEAAMEQLYADPALRERMGKQAITDSAQFSAEYMAKAYYAIYKEAAK